MENQNPQTAPTQPQNIPIEQSQPIQPPIKTYNWLRLLIGIVVVLFIVSIIGVGTFLLGTNRNNTKPVAQITPTPTSIPTPTIDPTANWQTYTGNGFLLKYPSEFATEKCPQGVTASLCSDKLDSSIEPLFYSISFGNEKVLPQIQGLQINYTQGSINDITAYRTVDLPSRSGAESVYFKNQDESYVSVLFSPYDKQSPFSQQQKFYDLFNQALSTFKFTDQQLPPGGQYSSEGQSCGTNAGPAGNAQCAPGLTCKYTTPQEQVSGIGTCIKE